MQSPRVSYNNHDACSHNGTYKRVVDADLDVQNPRVSYNNHDACIHNGTYKRELHAGSLTLETNVLRILNWQK